MSDVIAVALITTFGLIVVAVISALALIQSTKTHQLVNSRMTELLALTKSSAKDEGVKEEKERNEHTD